MKNQLESVCTTNFRSSANQLVQRQSTTSVINNRSVAQQKIQEAAINSTQVNKAALVQRMVSGPATSGQQPVIQRNKHLKRFLNVISLGGRKAYVKYKRAQQAGQNVLVPQVPQPIDSEEEFAVAYEKSRYYHKSDPGNLESIDQHGLLNHTERIEQFGQDVRGMSGLGGEFAGDEKKGVFLGPKKLMVESRMTQSVVRAYLPASRTVLHHWHDTDVPSQEIMLDEKFRGGAVITKDSVYGQHVTAKSISDLLDNDDPKIQTILESVASQYEGQAPNQETMKQLLRSAIRNRRLSNAPFDNIQG